MRPPALLARRYKTLDHEGPVHAGESHHVAHGRQRDQIEHRQQVGLLDLRPLDTKKPRRLHEREKHHARRAEMPLPRQVVLAIGIDHRDGKRQRPADLVVVEHDDFRSGEQGGVDRRPAVGAAVDGDDQRRATPGQFAHRLGVRPVAFEDAVRDIDFGLDPIEGEEALEQRRGGRAVHIVVAEYRDLFALPDGGRQSRRSALHVGQRGGIGQQVPDRRIEEALDAFGRHAAPGKDARDDVGNAVRLRDRQRRHLLALVQPVLPAQPGHRSLHAEKDAFVRHQSPLVIERR